MFQVGDTVVHPGEGLCEVRDICTKEFVAGQPREYYALRPLRVGAETTVFLPVDQTRVPLRAVMSKQLAQRLQEEARQHAPVWTANERERQERVLRILHEAEPVALMRLVMDLCAEQTRRRETGKKLRYADEHALTEARRLLRQELAAVLGDEAPVL